MKRRNNLPAITNLPADLFGRIFWTLPIKDILISKRVCKSWYGLLSDPDFSRSYAVSSPFTTLFLVNDSTTRTKSFSLLEFSADGEFAEIPIKPKLPLVGDLKTGSDLSIIGLCNDYLFLALRLRYGDGDCETRRVYLCNPFGGSCVEAFEYGFTESDDVSVCEAGYVPSTCAYKLVRLRFRGSKVRAADVFTVGSDRSWRALDGPLNFWDHPCPDVVCFNGAFHWLPKGCNETTADGICTFDLLGEKSGPKISLPSVYSRGSGLDMRVVVYKDRLSLVDHTFDAEMVIWTMKEYGVTESWSIDVVLKYMSPDPGGFGFKDSFPIAELPSGYLLKFGKIATAWGFFMFYSFEKGGLTWIKVADVSCARESGNLAAMSANTYAPRFHALEGNL